MTSDCSSTKADALLFACAGGSNVGQVSNDAAIALEGSGVGQLFCLAGVGGHVEGIVNRAAGAGCTIAIDGCEVACARKTLEAAGIDPTHHVVITELGVEKAKTYDYPEEHVSRTVDAVIAATGPGGAASSETPCCEA